jgi:hypothetical protein
MVGQPRRPNNTIGPTLAKPLSTTKWAPNRAGREFDLEAGRTSMPALHRKAAHVVSCATADEDAGEAADAGDAEKALKLYTRSVDGSGGSWQARHAAIDRTAMAERSPWELSTMERCS